MEIKIEKDIGYEVLSTNEDNTPKQVLRCFIKEGKYGKFISLEKHWVQKMIEDEIDTKWARWSVNIPYNEKEALNLITAMKQLVEQAVNEEFAD
jgi:hypothetical protein